MNKNLYNNPLVTISVHQKFHAFRLAEGLAKKEILRTLYTIYPKNRIKSYSIPLKRIKSYFLLGAFKYITCSKLKIKTFDYFTSCIFDFLVAYSLEKTGKKKEIFHGWNGASLKSIQRAKKLGYITVVERSCPHIDIQKKLIEEEQKRLLGKVIYYEEKKKVAMMKKEYEMADFIVTPSLYTRRSFIEKGYNPKKIITVPLSLEKITMRPKEKRTKRFKVLCIGGNFYRKGLYYLLRAWKLLNLENAELIIKGNIPKEFEKMKKINNLHLITQRLSNKNLAALYQKVDIFVLPSIDDGFGMVVVEAMTAGLPVIITKNVGVADGIKNGEEGFVVPIRDPEALAEKISYFYNNPQKINEMGNKAFKKSRIYAPEAYVNRMCEVYRKMIAYH